MTAVLNVAVIGCGTGGQATALMLAADGHRVEVFEQAQALGPVGAGLLVQPSGLSVLWEMGLLDQALRHGARIDSLYGETMCARPIMDMRYSDFDARLFGLGMQRGTLFSIMQAAMPSSVRIRCGHTITTLDPEAGTLTDADGMTHGAYDLVVVTNGAASRLRSAVAPASLNRPYPWGAQWCLVDQKDWSWPKALQQRYDSAKRMCGMLPVGTHPTDPTPRLSFFWSVPAAALPHPIAPQAWRAQVQQVWPQITPWLDTMDPTTLTGARYRDVVHRSWHRARAVLLGDAAHAMSPQLGQGANMALMDAQGLRAALRAHAHLPEALVAYERARRTHVSIYNICSRWLTPVFQSDHTIVPALRDRLFHPLSRLPLAKAQAARVLVGVQRGWFSTLPLPQGFVDALHPS